MGYPVGIVGESFHQDAIGKCRDGQRVTVAREFGNPYDVRAIVVLDGYGRKLGHIPRDCWLQEAIHDEGKGCDAKILSVEDRGTGKLGVVLDVELTMNEIDECNYEG